MRKKEGLFGKPLWQFKMRPLVVMFLVLLFAIPLYPKFPLSSVEGTYVAIRVEDWLVFLFLLAWLVWQIKNRFPIFKEKIFKLFLIYWVVGLVSLANAFLITDLMAPKIALLHFLRRIEYMSLFFIAFDAFKFMFLNEFAVALGLVSLLVFAYGMGQKFLGLPVVSTMNEEFSKGLLLRLDKWTRISSSFAGHYDLAAWLTMLLSLLPALIVTNKKRITKLGLIAVFLINFYLLTLTASRISFVAYLLGITATFLLLKNFRWLTIVLVLSLFFGLRSEELSTRLASSFKFLAIISPSPEELEKVQIPVSPAPELLLPTPLSEEMPIISPLPKEKILREVRTWPKPEEIEAAAARSSAIRFNIEWPRAIRAFLKNPLLGTGYSSLGLATDNDYLRNLGETGILGFFSFLLIIFHLARTGLTALIKNGEFKKKEFRNREFRNKQLVVAGFLGVLVCFLANAFFIDVLEASKDAFYFWMMMGAMYQISNKQINK